MNITIRYNGLPITLNPQPIKGSASDSYFNLKDQGLVTPVKDQGSMGAAGHSVQQEHLNPHF